MPIDHLEMERRFGPRKSLRERPEVDERREPVRSAPRPRPLGADERPTPDSCPSPEHRPRLLSDSQREFADQFTTVFEEALNLPSGALGDWQDTSLVRERDALVCTLVARGWSVTQLQDRFDITRTRANESGARFATLLTERDPKLLGDLEKRTLPASDLAERLADVIREHHTEVAPQEREKVAVAQKVFNLLEQRYGYTTEEMKENSSRQPLRDVRAVAKLLLYEKLGSYYQTAQVLGVKEPTIVDSVARMRKRLKQDEVLRHEVELLRARLVDGEPVEPRVSPTGHLPKSCEQKHVPFFRLVGEGDLTLPPPGETTREVSLA